MIWAIMCEMLPDKDGNRVVRMHGTTFETEVGAVAKQGILRCQNLPFRTWVVSFADPRG